MTALRNRVWIPIAALVALVVGVPLFARLSSGTSHNQVGTGVPREHNLSSGWADFAHNFLGLFLLALLVGAVVMVVSKAEMPSFRRWFPVVGGVLAVVILVVVIPV